METRLELLLRGPIHRLECMTDCIEMQEFDVIQAIVLLIVLVEVAANEVGDMDEARVNKCCRGVSEDDRLEFRNRKVGGELDEMGYELEPAGKVKKSVTFLE